jgi:hypothetical protein
MWVGGSPHGMARLMSSGFVRLKVIRNKGGEICARGFDIGDARELV